MIYITMYVIMGFIVAGFAIDNVFKNAIDLNPKLEEKLQKYKFFYTSFLLFLFVIAWLPILMVGLIQRNN